VSKRDWSSDVCSSDLSPWPDGGLITNPGAWAGGYGLTVCRPCWHIPNRRNWLNESWGTNCRYGGHGGRPTTPSTSASFLGWYYCHAHSGSRVFYGRHYWWMGSRGGNDWSRSRHFLVSNAKWCRCCKRHREWSLKKHRFRVCCNTHCTLCRLDLAGNARRCFSRNNSDGCIRFTYCAWSRLYTHSTNV